MTDMDDALAQDNLMLLKGSRSSTKTWNCRRPTRSRACRKSKYNVSAPGSSSLITAAAVSARSKARPLCKG